VGNSTHWIVLEGTAVLTDPWVSEPADSMLAHRLAPQPLPTDPDVVLISHGHGDHFDPAALDLIDRKAAVIVPEGLLADRVKALGFSEVHGARAGQRLEVRGLEIEVVRGKHSTLEVCYRVERRGRSFFFGGDTMLTPEIETLADRRPTPLAVMAAERSALLGFRFVMTPPEAVSLALRFRAELAVLSHHETFVSRRWPFGWMVRVPPPDPAEFPPWFRIPTPGDFIPFPWTASGEVVQ
jgi:L-ascorbate metabolism protein UlaG (beta-lactamase superfamily)